MNTKNYYENPEILHIGCEENRAYFIPFSDRSVALSGIREKSDRFFLLNGEWDFCYYSDVSEIPDGFEGIKYDKITVPSNWQMMGYDSHQYTNTRYPFPYDPPYISCDNPCGLYQREFEFTKTGEKYYINFEGVDSCFYLWLNGEFIGYSQVSHSTSEFDITSVLKDGKNVIRVLVLKWCDGSYLEDQDKFRMSGIFRDVYILSRPQEHIRDFFINTKKDGTVIIDIDGPAAKVSLYDGERLISEDSGTDIIFKVENPVLWNAEKPYLYTLIIECNGEVIAQKIGIREIEIKNGIVYLNDVKIKMKGVNRHDSGPVTGYVISREQAICDMRLMKQCNMNAIRTSHYPNAPWFTELCDEFGFYVVGEADLEGHGCTSIYDGTYDIFGQLAQDEQFYDAFLDRIQRCVIRDKNRTSIVIWSLGNETGYGEAFELALEWLKKYDASRLTHYESSIWESLGHKNDTSLLNVYSDMYATPERIEKYFEEHEQDKPYMLCEYIHAMGNGPGGIEDYTALMDKYDGFFAAFVWEWCDHGIYMGEENGRSKYYYGGDFGEFPHDDNFCMDGLTYPDRTPHTGLLEYKNNIRPIRARIENGKFIFENRRDFTNTSEDIDICAEYYCNGESVGKQSIGSIDIEPHKINEVSMAYFDIRPYEEFSVKITYRQNVDDWFLKKDHELGFDFITIQKGQKREERHIGKINAEETDGEIFVSGKNFTYIYNKRKGEFKSFIVNGEVINETTLGWNIWRAPTDNDRNIRIEWEKAGFDRAFTRAYSTEICVDEVCVTINARLAVLAVYIQRIVDIDVQWSIYGDGHIVMSAKCRKNDAVPFLPRLGLRMGLKNGYNKVKYFGYGPYESYPDKCGASYKAVFESNVSQMHEDYIKPQENGSHCHTSFLSVSDKNSKVIVAGDDFSFNVSEYTQEELTAKKHNFELEKCGYTVLCIDGAMSGIGSNSCGPELSEKWRVQGEFSFDIEISFE